MQASLAVCVGPLHYVCMRTPLVTIHQARLAELKQHSLISDRGHVFRDNRTVGCRLMMWSHPCMHPESSTVCMCACVVRLTKVAGYGLTEEGLRLKE